ncbi:hypothetical protein [Arundinibacter roseus]|uniref:Uncharacterized protein n=1 Tax=Arundinibacter roseus TaxID=2070510 RepID=A0A4R4KLG2_9BACT|nr:hypothetical protein [Arundinibacter roseus]TDB69194.1 hypothetical protein EZE20_02350 [Arundinibacter roseus]
MRVIDKVIFKKALIELASNDPVYLRELLLEVKDDLKKAKRKRLEEIVNEDFEEYEEVFRALA